MWRTGSEGRNKAQILSKHFSCDKYNYQYQLLIEKSFVITVNFLQAFSMFRYTGLCQSLSSIRLFNSRVNLKIVLFLNLWALLCSKFNHVFSEKACVSPPWWWDLMQEIAAMWSTSCSLTQNLSWMMGGGGARPKRIKWSQVVSITWLCIVIISWIQVDIKIFLIHNDNSRICLSKEM